MNGGTCKVDEVSRKYNCYCLPNFSGSLCQDVCSKKCANGVCVKGAQGVEECQCKDGWSGILCEVSGSTIEGCIRSEDCSDGKKCIENERGLKVCLADPCDMNPCKNNATCHAETDDYHCDCPLGYGGKNCDTDVNECELSPCRNGATCINLDGTFECLCNERFKGVLCADADLPCSPNPCKNNGECVEMIDDFHCICSNEFAGKTCDIEISSGTVDACQPSPCLNGGRCNPTEESYECLCHPDYSGENCEIVTECTVEGRRCMNGGTCVRGLSRTYCKCSTDYAGVFCETLQLNFEVDPCLEKPCLNGGTCSNRDGNITCDCLPLYHGPFCGALTSVDPCQPNPCQNNGHCEPVGDPSEGGFSCRCSDRFAGNMCETMVSTFRSGISEVTIHTTTDSKLTSQNVFTIPPTLKPHQFLSTCEACVNSEKCIETEDASVCICLPGYSGVTCEKRGDICDNSKCTKPQVCRKRVRIADSEIRCACPAGFVGELCNVDTTVSFTENSLFIYQNPNLMIGSSSGVLPYDVSFSFRTTVPNVHLVSADSIFASKLFSLYLDSGKLTLNITGTVYKKVSTVAINDGQWYTVELQKTQKDFQVNLLEESGYEILSKSFPRNSQFEIYSTRIGKVSDTDFFLGCISNLKVDAVDIPMFSSNRGRFLQPGCKRIPQCKENQCQNEGACIDLWTKSTCDCKPPFLPPNCAFSLLPATFGHNNKSSLVEISVPNELSENFRTETNIQFLLKTNKPSGSILYLGEAEADEVGTFTSVELVNGTISVRTRAGGKAVNVLTGRRSVIDSNEHLVRIERTQRHVKLFVDGIFESEGDITSRFDHPMFVEKLVIGSPDNETVKAFTSTAYYKGSLQDIRVNDISAILENEPAVNMDGIGRIVQMENVQEGLVSDDICTAIQPCDHGTCYNTFNDYECVCQMGFFGKNCEQKDYCITSPCPADGTCQNVNGGFICTSSASLVKESILMYNLDVAEAEELSFIELSIRTHSDHGRIFTMNSEIGNIVMSIVNKQLVITTSSPFTIRKTIADGTWKNIRLEGNILKINNASYGLPSSLTIPTPLNKAHLTLGTFGSFPSFVGCIDKVRFGNTPVLSFYREEDLKIPSDLHYWKNSQRKRISTKCLSSPQCGDMSPCLNGAECRDEWNSFRCLCSFGFTGARCEININECEKADCVYGHCIDSLGDYRCQCDVGYTGLLCDTIIDQCANNPCQNNALCSSANGSVSCECVNDWRGKFCDIPKPQSCELNPCQNNGTCRIMEDKVSCSCLQGTTGEFCEAVHDACSTRPCLNGVCQKTRTGFTCICEEGFAGQTCSEIADYCTTDSCGIRGKCIPAWNNTMCDCDEGFVGKKCTKQQDACLTIPCENDGECSSSGPLFKCNCRNYYLGDRCEVEGSCLTNPCEHGDCIQLKHDEHACRCHKGYEGANCATKIDYCKLSPCRNGARCESLIGEYKCHCLAGFNGSNCEEDIDECAFGFCSNGSKCLDHVNDYECVCNDTGYKGKNCTEDVDECAVTTSCIHGVCTNIDGGYRCNCQHENCTRSLYSNATKFYSNATKFLQEVKEVLESMNLGGLTITKPSVTIVCPYAGKTVQEQRKIVMARIPEEFRSAMDFQIVVQEGVGDVIPGCLKEVEHPPDPRILATPQAHLDNAVYLLSRRQGSSASEQLWFHQSKTVLVDYLTDRYGSDDIFNYWRVLGDSHSNGYEDRKTLKQVRRDLAPTIHFCNALYNIHKQQELVEKKAIAPEEFLEWFKIEYEYLSKPVEKLWKLYRKV
ncbi:unnamed protein product [Auanema sp. JU1783]|nr:unnamed protein product [Auanema sp. JU1783]